MAPDIKGALLNINYYYDSIAAHGALNPRPFGYKSCALTNCAITASIEQNIKALIIIPSDIILAAV